MKVTTIKFSLLIRHPRFQECFWRQLRKRYLTESVSDSENTESSQKSTNFDRLGTWDNRIVLPLLLPESIKHGKPIPKISLENIGCASLMGRRDTNEDRFHVKELSPGLLYFAVFDGHGGSIAADFACSHLERHIKFWLDRDSSNLGKILQNAFIDLNNALARNVHFHNQGDTSGTTATVCLLRDSVELTTAHVGDSRAILCRENNAVKLTIDHDPERDIEKQRVQDWKGVISWNSVGRALVNGRLAMTRSIGDFELKRWGVIAEPETKQITVKHGRDSFLILTTDGINYVLTDQDICNSIGRCHNPVEAATFIVDQAQQCGTDDNATAIVIPFGAWGKFGTSNTELYSFGRHMAKSSRFN